MIVRPATAADLGQVHEIWYRAEIEGSPDPPPQGGVPPIFRHELDTGELYVAEDDVHILGYTTLIRRDQVAYLAELYVRDDARSSGVGRALLGQVLPVECREPSPNQQARTEVRGIGSGREACSNGSSRKAVFCTLSSADPRALALYIRAGMQPQWPHFWLYADSNRLGELPPGDIEIVPAQPGDPELVRWDTGASGRHRPQDHAYWISDAAATPLWFVREGETIGYGYVQRRNHEVALWHPEALSLGPIGACSAPAALVCTQAAVRWAVERAPVLAVGVPAAHPCLPILLEAGFYITYVETFVSTAPAALVDPACYLPSGSTLF